MYKKGIYKLLSLTKQCDSGKTTLISSDTAFRQTQLWFRSASVLQSQNLGAFWRSSPCSYQLKGNQSSQNAKGRQKKDGRCKIVDHIIIWSFVRLIEVFVFPPTIPHTATVCFFCCNGHWVLASLSCVKNLEHDSPINFNSCVILYHYCGQQIIHYTIIDVGAGADPSWHWVRDSICTGCITSQSHRGVDNHLYLLTISEWLINLTWMLL